MCQGRFREAEDVAEQLDALAAPAAKEFRGDVARLRHLAHRLAFDHSASARYLELAADYYHQAGATIGLANIQTNRAELLALTDPAAAVVEAGRAIEVQQDIGAQHELGKAYTALALAQTQLGQLTEAEVSMQAAVAALDRAGYRSGRARAELFTAAIHVRRGEMTAAVDAAKWAITELEASEVYPTLVLAAAQALEIIGRLDAEVTEARDRARRGIQPMNDLGDLESRLGAFMTQLLQGSS
jgi:tetratricopeptide (TPR) repeat protein